MFSRSAIRSTWLLLLIVALAATGVRAGDILFISAMDEATDSGDAALRIFLEGLGHTVTLLDDDESEEVTEEAAAAAEVVFISESVSSGAIRTEITEIETPMVITEAWGWDEMGLTLGGGGGSEVATADIDILTPGHPLAAGLSGTVSVLDALVSDRGTARFGLGQAGDDATVIARATLADEQTYDVIFVYEKGATLPVAPADGSPAVAADMRICLGFDEQSYLVWNENAYALLAAAINYALGVRPDADLAFDPDPSDGATDVPRDTPLTWTPGESATTHDVYLGTNLDDVNLATRAGTLDVLASQGQDANTYEPTSLLEFGRTYYWRIDEVSAAPDETISKGRLWTFTTEPLAHPVENIVATTNTTSQADQGIENTINGSGLDIHDQHSLVPEDMWLGTPAADGEPLWIQYEFERAYKLTEMYVWNYNSLFELVLGIGLKDVTVDYSVDGTDWLTLGDLEFVQAPATEGYAYNTTIDFQGAAAKYVRLTVNSNWGGLAQYGLSEVRFLHVPTYAREPQPASGQTDLEPNVTLSWRAGREAVSHEIHLSTDEDAVAAGSAPIETVADSQYDPGALDFGTRYYWKIVEVNEAEAVPSWLGDVWNFATLEYAVIDDFEGYDDDQNPIFETWIDGWINGTGSTVGYLVAPFAEKTITYDGSQSMPVAYDNSVAPWYSETERTFATAQDWTTNGADTLVLYFRGHPIAFRENADGSIVMSAGGEDIWDTADEFRFAWKRLNGDGAIVARIDSLVETDPWAKAGVMIRESLDPGSKFAAVYMTPGNGCRFQARAISMANAESDTSVATAEQMALTIPYWVKLERTGDQFNGFYSADGTTWTAMSWNPQTMSMASSIYIGVAVTSHNPDQTTIAEVSNITTTANLTGSWEVEPIGVEQPSNDPDALYVGLEDSAGRTALLTHSAAEATAVSDWQAWTIPLDQLSSTGIDLTSIKTMSVGIGDRDNPSPGGVGTVFIDGIKYGRPTTTP